MAGADVPGSVNCSAAEEPEETRSDEGAGAATVPADNSTESETNPGGRQREITNPDSFLQNKKKALGLHHRPSNSLQLPPCTVWVGNLPHGIASNKQLKGLFEQKYGEVDAVTVRKKDVSERSWAFVTFVEPDSMTACLESSMQVYDQYLDQTVELKMRLPWTQARKGAGAMKNIAREHKAHKRWVDVANSMRSNGGGTRKLVQTRGLGEMMMDSHRLQQAEHRKCFFMPHRTFRIGWDVVQMIILLYVALIYPVRAAMAYEPSVGSIAMVLDVCIDFWFILDILVNFRTAYRNEEDETIVVDLKKIARRYICGFRSGGGYFIIDLISSLPIQYFAMLVANDEDEDTGKNIRLFKVLRLLRLARLLRLLRLRALTREYEDTAVFDMFESLKLVHMILLIMWMAHIAACVWYYTGTVDQTFTTTDGGNETILGWVNTEYGPASGNMRTEDSFRAYLMALHAVNPKMYDLNDAVSEEFTTSMLLVAVILETLGLVGFGVVIGSLSTYISSGKQEQVKYKQKMDVLHDFFRANDVPFELRKNVRMFYDNLLRKKNVFDEDAILASLPPVLANDLIYTLYADTIMRTPMFIGLEVEVVAKLCMKLTPFHVLSGNVISKEGHKGNEVYIVQKGEVLISRGGKHLAVIGPGASFGEMSALGFSLGKNGNQRDKTATAVTEVDLVFITGRALYELTEEYESLRLSIKAVVEKRMKDRRKTRRNASTNNGQEITTGVVDDEKFPSLGRLSSKQPDRLDYTVQQTDLLMKELDEESSSSDQNDKGQTAQPASLCSDRSKQTAITGVGNSVDTARLLHRIDQTLNTLVQEQAELAQRVGRMEQSMEITDSSGFASSTKYDVSQCARKLMASATNIRLARVNGLQNGMGLSDGLANDSSDEELPTNPGSKVTFAQLK